MNKLTLLSLLSAALLLQSQAFAGAQQPAAVSVGSTYADGALQRARFNSGTTEAIGCLAAPSTGSQNYISCSATDASGQSYYCYSNTAPQSWVDSIAGLNAASFLYFYGDTTHHCLGIYSYQFSFYL